MVWLDWLSYLTLFVMLVVGLIINLVGLPGLWVMIAAVMAYAWLTGWMYVGWKLLAGLVVMGLAAEVVEFIAGSAGARAAGSSRRGAMGAIVGALAGGVVGSGILFLVGTVIGAVIGAFAGAAVVELLIGKSVQQSMEIGVGAARGRILGMVSKTAIGAVMLIVAMAAAFPGCGPRRAPLPTTIPSTRIAQ
jgi:uncharacterized protein YqgC (DUF456 family)